MSVGWKHSIACAIHDGAPCSCKEDAVGSQVDNASQVAADRLAKIEQSAEERRYAVAIAGGDKATQDWAAIALSTGDVLALVEVAKAARALMDAEDDAENRLYGALARLDSGNTEGDA